MSPVGIIISLLANLLDVRNQDFRMLEYSNKYLIEKNGFGYEPYKVLTDDGYLLGLHRIVNRNCSGPPFLLINGFFVRSRSWILRGRETDLLFNSKSTQPTENCRGSVGNVDPTLATGTGVAYRILNESIQKDDRAFILADLCYDVWLGDQRGNPYSLQHTNYSIHDPKYWDFSFHEIGTHDLPAMIDFILKESTYEKLTYVGLSLGSTFFFPLLSEKQEYNRKISSSVLLVPFANTVELEKYNNPLRTLIESFTPLWGLIKTINMTNFELNNLVDVMSRFVLLTCSGSSRKLCFRAIEQVYGGSSDNFDKEHLAYQVASSLGYTSFKIVEHVAQIYLNGEFSQFDFGPEVNLKKYGKVKPPGYNLSKIEVPTAIFMADKDNPVPLEAAMKTAKALGKYARPQVFRGFNHIEMALGLRSNLVYENILKFIKEMKP